MLQKQQRSSVERSVVMPTTQEQYVPWNQQPPPPTTTSVYPDPTGNYDSNFYTESIQPNAAATAGSNQLARRAVGQQLVPRVPYGNVGNENWPVVADEDVNQANEDAWMNNGDDLEQKAMIAKRETQAKRKQIPPFVQKLTR